jgi:hypothetical protein
MWTIYLLVLTVFTSTDTTYLLSTRVFVLFIWCIFLNTVRRRCFWDPGVLKCVILKCRRVCGITDGNHPGSRSTWLATILASYPFLHCTRLFEIDGGVWNNNAHSCHVAITSYWTQDFQRSGWLSLLFQLQWCWNDGWVWCHCKAKKCIINTYIYINIYIHI